MADIGGLFATLGLDTAQFESGLTKAQQRLKNFENASKQSAKGIEGIQTSMASAARGIQAAIGAVVGSAFVQFIGQTIQATAEIGRLAQMAGVTTGQFQQMAFAFQQVGLGQQEVIQGLSQYQRNLSELNQNTGSFLDYLRQSYPGLQDQFRGITDVNEAMDRLLEVASRITDPMDRMRFLTAAAGDSFARVAHSIPQLREELGKARTDFVGVGDDAIKEAQRIEREWNRLAQTVANTLKGIVVGAAGLLSGPPGRGTIADVEARLRDARASLEAAMPSQRESIQRRIDQLEADLRRLQTIQDQIRDMEASSQGPSAPEGLKPRDAGVIQQLQYQYELFLQLALGNRVLEQSIYPLNNAYSMFAFQISPSMVGSLGQLNIGMMTHAEIVEEAHRRIQAAFTNTAEAQIRMAQITQQMNLKYQQDINQTAQKVGNALVAVFPKSKAAAIAQATINTAVGVTEALKLPFPLNWIQAAAVAASGVAQIAAIRSANVGGGGSVPSPGGGAAGGSSNLGQGQMPTQIVIGQLDPSAIISGEAVNRLIDAVNERARNGTIVLSTQVI